MINLITSSNLDEHFPEIYFGLSRALTKTTLGQYWDMASLFKSLKRCDVYAFHQVESGYSGVFSLGGSPLSKTLFFFWSGKDKDNTTPIDFIEVNRMLDNAALHFGCRYIQCEGRRGWKPILEPLGYVEDSTNFVREVAYELAPV